MGTEATLMWVCSTAQYAPAWSPWNTVDISMDEIWYPIFWRIHDSIVSMEAATKTMIVSSTMRCTRIETSHAVQRINWRWESCKHLWHHLKSEGTILLDPWHDGPAPHLSFRHSARFGAKSADPLYSACGVAGKRRNCDMACVWRVLDVYNR